MPKLGGITDSVSQSIQAIAQSRQVTREAAVAPVDRTAALNDEMLARQAQRSANAALRYVENARLRNRDHLEQSLGWTPQQAMEAVQQLADTIESDPEGAVEAQGRRLPRRSIAALLR